MGLRPVVSVLFLRILILFLFCATGTPRALAAPEVASFKINNGAATTANPAVTLPNVCAGATSATHAYLASESADFTSATWLPYRSIPLFILSQEAGEKTVYFKAKDYAGIESNVTSDTITLVGGGYPLEGAGYSVVAWGDNSLGQCEVPPPNSGFVAVAVGGSHSLGLKADGSIVAWGANDYSQCNVPVPDRGFVAVSAGGFHSLGLKADGSIVAWGYNYYGQCNVTAPNTRFVAVAAGGSHSLGLKADGSIVAWGKNDYGQCNVRFPNSGFAGVAAKGLQSLGLRSDGSIVAWGDNSSAQCYIPSPNTDFVTIAAGAGYNLGLKSDGSITAWGYNGSGQCNTPLSNTGFVGLATRWDIGLGLKSNGSFVAWGDNVSGLTAVPSPNTGFLAVAGGGSHSLALAVGGNLQVTLTPPRAAADGAQWRLTSETAKEWHDSGDVVRGTRPLIVTFKDIYGWIKPTDQQVELTSTTTARATGDYTPVNWTLTASCNNGTILTSPEGSSFPHGSTVTLTVQPDPGYWLDHWVGSVPSPQERMNPVVITMDGNKTIGVDLETGALPPAPGISVFKINNGSPITANPAVTLSNTCTAETSASAACYLASESPSFSDTDGHPYASVPLFVLSPGVGKKTVYFKVKNSGGGESIVTSDTITLCDPGFLMSWGTGVYGPSYMRSPLVIPSPNNEFISVAAGFDHSLGLKANGSIVAWGGGNEAGQCNVPSPNSGFIALAAGGNKSLGLKSDGSVVAWGGLNSVPNPNRDFVAVAVGNHHCLGLKSDGSIVAWGNISSAPTPNSGFISIAAGPEDCLGVKSDGSIVIWTNFQTILIPSDGFVAAAEGTSHRLGLKSDGSIVTLGSDNYDEEWTIPSPNRDFIAVAAGNYRSMGLKSNGLIMTWGSTYSNNGHPPVPAPGMGYVAMAFGMEYSLALATRIPSSYPLETPATHGSIRRDPDWTTYPRGTTVTLTAQPDTGYWLDHWMGDVPVGLERVNPLVITMDSTKTITMDLFASPTPPPAPMVSSFKINNGAVFTANPAVTLPNACAGETSGTVTSCLASESPDFSGASWRPYMPVPLFVLSGAPGTKTVYFKVKNSEGLESAVTSDTITLGGDGYPVVAWGSNADLGCAIPLPNKGFLAVSSGIYHNLGLKADGSVVTWGNKHKVYDRGQFDVPTPNSGFVAVAAGDFHSLGLKADGSIVAWGDNASGQCDVPVPNIGFIAIVAGADHSLGLKADGSIIGWGKNEFGQSFVPTPNSGFVAISARGGHSLGLKADGSVVAWGRNDFGQCTVPLPSSGFVAVSAGNEHSLGLKANGSVVVWGNNDYGQSVLPEPNSEFMAVAAGYYHNLALKADGSIVAWGMDYAGQCEPPTPNSGFTAVAGGEFHSLALVEAGTLQVTLTPPEAVTAGAQWRLTSEPAEKWHSSGETLVVRPGLDTLTFKKIAGWIQPEDQPVAATTGVSLLATGAYFKPTSCSLTTACAHGSVEVSPSGTLFPFGSTVTLTAQPAPGYWFDHWTGDVPAGLERINPLVLTMDGDKDIQAVVAAGPLPPAPVISAFSINNGTAVTINPTVVLCCACTDETSASAAQYMASESPNFSGAVWQPYRSLSLFHLSQGAGEKTVYFKAKNSANVESAVVSDTISLGGTGLGIAAWGRNNCPLSPIFSSQDDYLAISAGDTHGLALKSDGSVLAWGSTHFGQGTAPEPNNNFVSVSAGTLHSLGLKVDGAIVAWGHKGFGQCAVPQPNSGFVAVSAGSIHSLGLKADGSIAAWGDNFFGQRDVPSPNSGFVAVAAGGGHNLGLKADRTIVTWGYDRYGQCALPSPNSDFVAIAAGTGHSLALKADGSIVAWGDNSFGQCAVPSPNSGFIAIAAGAWHSLGLKSDGSIVAWGDNSKKQCEVPSPNTAYAAVSAGEAFSLAIERQGALQVTLAPPGILAKGARWRLTREAPDVWHDDTVYDPVSDTSSTIMRAGVGVHTLTFKEVRGWTRPADQTLEVTSSGTLQVTGAYKEIMYTLSTMAEHGAVQISPNGSTFHPDTTVTLTAVPDPGYLFVGWTGDIPQGQKGVNPITVVMDRYRRITANFLTTEEEKATLSVEATGQGSVAVNPDLMFYAVGTTVTLTATPASGHRFVRWEGDVPVGEKKKETLVLTMTASKTVRAVFEVTPPSVPMWLISRADGSKAMGWILNRGGGLAAVSDEASLSFGALRPDSFENIGRFHLDRDPA